MINIDSKNALSMIRFDMEIANTWYFDVEKKMMLTFLHEGRGEGHLAKVRRLIIAYFYRKIVLKGKTYTAPHFMRMGC